MLHGNGSTIVVNDVVQMEKKMISNKSKEKVGIAKRSKKFHDACVQGGFTCTFGCGIQTHAQAICPGFIMVRTDYATGTVQNCTHSVAGMYFNRLFLQHKQAVLQVILSNVHLAVVQQVKSIMEYKQIENNKDLIGTLHILKDICFEDRNGGLTFPQMTFLEQWEWGLTFKQCKHNNASYKENICTSYQSLKSQTRKFSYGTASLVTIIMG